MTEGSETHNYAFTFKIFQIVYIFIANTISRFITTSGMSKSIFLHIEVTF